jgi:hypothetical protein
MNTHFPECKDISILSVHLLKCGHHVHQKFIINSLLSVAGVVAGKIHHVSDTIALGKLRQAKNLFAAGTVGGCSCMLS